MTQKGNTKTAPKDQKFTPRCHLTAVAIAKIRAETMLAERTIRRWADGWPVDASTNVAISKAMQKIGATT